MARLHTSFIPMCQIVFASCDVIIQNTWSHTWRAACQGQETQNIQDPTKSPNLVHICTANKIVAFCQLSSGLLWRVNQRQSSGSCDRTSGASPAILSHHIQSAFYTSCVHKGGTYPGPPQPLAFTPLSLPLVLPPHASVPTRST